MKKIILAAAVMTALASASFAFEMSELENAAAISGQTGGLGSARSAADMPFSGGMAANDKGAVAVGAGGREETQRQEPSLIVKKEALMSKVPALQTAAKSEKAKDEPGFVETLWLGLKAPVSIAKYGAIFAIQMVSPGSTSTDPLTQIAAGIVGGVLGAVVGVGIMLISPVAAVKELFKGNFW